ncbi:MAG TPA: DUF4097 family beta strand repeat-containing protein [Woeseiaceae bacterium]|nr:DUF4097 family beta strand repeat-containing protein [Woeseiaceae bacterium]
MNVSAKISLAGLALTFAATAMAENVERRLDAAEDGLVTIENTAGSVEVRGWSRNEVEITGELGRDVEELVFERDGNEVRIEVRAPHGNNTRISSDLEIRVPERSSVNVSGVSTDISVNDVRGDLRLGTVSGDIDAQGFEADIDIETVSGDVEAQGRGEEASSRLASVSGDIDVAAVVGEIRISTVSGDLSIIEGSFERAEINTTSGDAVLRAALVGDGRLDMETINGDLDVNFDGDVSARFDIETFNGEIRNCFGPEPVRTSQYTPGQELRFTEGGGASRVTIKTLNGDLTLCRD